MALLAACGSVARQPSPTPSAAFTVEFRRTGGFAGLDDRLVVMPDGRAHRVTRRGACDLQVAPADLEALHQSLDQAGVTSLPSATPNTTVLDALEYDVTYGGASRHYSEEQVPARMRPALTRLTALLDRPCPG